MDSSRLVTLKIAEVLPIDTEPSLGLGYTNIHDKSIQNFTLMTLTLLHNLGRFNH
jgi:hypothetical protein